MKKIFYTILVLICFSYNQLMADNCVRLLVNQGIEVCIVIKPKNESYSEATDPFNKNYSDVDFFAESFLDMSSNGDAFWYETVSPPAVSVPFVKNQTYEITYSVSLSADPDAYFLAFLSPTMELQWYEAGYGGFTTQGFISKEWKHHSAGGAVWSHTFEFTPTRNTISENGSTWSRKGLRINLFAENPAVDIADYSLSSMIPFVTTGPKSNQIEIKNTSMTPSIPYLVLHDPPGDESFSSITANVEHCQAVSWSTQSDNELGVWAKAKVGTKISNSFLGLAEIETEVYASATGSFSMTMSQNQSGETERCIKTSTTFSTSGDNNAISGERGDVFIGKAMLMSMGLGENISYGYQGEFINEKELVIAPTGVDSEFAYTENYIRYTLIPELEETINTSNSDSGVHKTAKRQLEVWQQALATNDALKNSSYTKTVSFSANAEKNLEESVSTSEINTIETSVDIDMNLAIEAGIEIAGNGISGGGNMRLRTQTGFGSGSSSNTTNSISYTLKDGDQTINGPGSDNFTVGIIHDGKHGTPAFVLVDGETSCPYEGGYQIDQPDFKFGDGSKSFSTTGEIGETLVVPVQICNQSKYPRNYHLKLTTGTNSNGLLINVGGTVLNSTDAGHFFGSVPAEGCEETNLIINSPAETITNFSDIELYLYACSEDVTQDGALISSSGSLTVNFQTAAAPYNNSCEAVMLPTDGSIQGPFDNTFANAEANENLITPPATGCTTNDGWCVDGAEIENSVWFTFVAPNTGQVSVSTCGMASFDTQIAVYASSNCSDFGKYTLLGANDDGPENCATDYDSYLELMDLNPGQTYFVLVDGFGAAAGEFNISISTLGSLAPAYNNSCDAVSLPVDGTVQGPFDNTYADSEVSESLITPPGTGCEMSDGWCEDGIEIESSVWFTFVAPSTGQVSVSTCGLASFDTQIAVYSASSCSDFGTYTLLGANDDGPTSCATDYDSYLELMDLNPGQTYFVLVDGNDGSSGEFEIVISTLSTTTSTDDLGTITNVNVFPNPASDGFTIDSDEAFDHLQLFSSSGQLILEVNDPSKINNREFIDLPALQDGLYMGILSSKNQIHSFKLSVLNQ